MKSKNLPLLAGLLIIGILATTDHIKSITIEDAAILDNSLIAIANIQDANIQDDQILAEITMIAA